MRQKPEETVDLYICKEKIKALLREFNCSLMDGDEGSYIILMDNDTLETTNALSDRD